VTGHPAGGSAEAFAQSTAPFHHGRPEGLEEMGDSFVKKMRRGVCTSAPCSLGWAALLRRTRTSSAAIPASYCWLPLHAGKGSVGQWRTKLLDPGYLGKEVSLHDNC
jgi:hypothetical protein